MTPRSQASSTTLSSLPTRTRPGVRVHYSSLGERGAGPWGPASPPGKGPWMTEVRDAVMRRWLTSDIHESADWGSRLVLTSVIRCWES